MSFEAMTWAIKKKTGSSTRKLILLLLADRANEDGVCWPSLSRIAEDCEISRDSVIRHIKQLERDGLIFVVRNSNKNNKGYVQKIIDEAKRVGVNLN